MRIRIIVGYLGLKIMNLFPANGSCINLFQQKLRCFFGKIYLSACGDHVNIQKDSRFSHRCKIGDYSGIGEGSHLYGEVVIGKYVMMGTNCTIYTQNHAFSRIDIPMCFQGSQKEKKVVIEDDVWIGGNVTILPGVTIKTGAVIGASAVVSKDVPEYAIVVGNPAKIVKYRNKAKSENENY